MIKRILTFHNTAEEGKPPACIDFERAWTYLCFAKDGDTYEQYEEIVEIKREMKKHGTVKLGFNDTPIPHLIEFNACCAGGCKITYTEHQLKRFISAVKSCSRHPELVRNASAEEFVDTVKFLEAAEKVEE